MGLSSLEQPDLNDPYAELGPVRYPVNPVIVVKEVVKPVKGVRGVKLDSGSSSIRHLGKGRQAIDELCKPADGLT